MKFWKQMYISNVSAVLTDFNLRMLCPHNMAKQKGF